MVVETAKHSRIPTMTFLLFSVIMSVFSIYTIIDLLAAAAGNYGQNISDMLEIFSGFLTINALIILGITIVIMIVLTIFVALLLTWIMRS
ncbi:MAG: hypothetical protein ACTSP4_16925 [Candidatus Hodarchaeales archaeon]